MPFLIEILIAGLSLFSSFFVLLLVLVQVLPSSATETQLGLCNVYGRDCYSYYCRYSNVTF